MFFGKFEMDKILTSKWFIKEQKFKTKAEGVRFISQHKKLCKIYNDKTVFVNFNKEQIINFENELEKYSSEKEDFLIRSKQFIQAEKEAKKRKDKQFIIEEYLKEQKELEKYKKMDLDLLLLKDNDISEDESQDDEIDIKEIKHVLQDIYKLFNSKNTSKNTYQLQLLRNKFYDIKNNLNKLQ
jgi:hypothetical protein